MIKFPISTFLLTLAALATSIAPAAARDSYVDDAGGFFSAATVKSVNTTIADFAQTTGKEIVVVTVPSLDGATITDAGEKAFASHQVNGVMIYLAKAEKKDLVVGDRASRAFFPAGSFDSIRQAMRGYFRSGDFDQGLTTGVSLIIDQYRSHERSLGAAHRNFAPVSRTSSFGGGGMSFIWLILILIAGFLILRAIFRAVTGPRMMPPGYGGPGYGGPGYGGPGYGGPGYGGGYGGGGGGFFSGLLGGLGGAFIGNELFGRRDDGFNGGSYGEGNIVGGDGGYAADASGWQSDAGQADMGNASSGDFGSSGGGFDGGGFDGGGGDSGGGW